MEENSVSVKSVSMKWGLIHGLISIILFVIIDLIGMAGNQGLQWLGLPVFIAIMVLAHREFKNDGDGYMSYGQGLGIGTLLSVVAGIISSAFTYIYITYINTDYLSGIKEMQIMQLESQGMSDSEIEQTMEMTKMFFTPEAMAGFGIFFGILFGFIFALIITAFTKKPKPEII